jgi:hypothetical protein
MNSLGIVAGLLAAAACSAAVLAASSGRRASTAVEELCRLEGLPVPTFATTSISEERFRALHAAVAPRGASERWAEIPWQTDLLAAREKAARERKPLLMWVMDGHPLGCT